MTSITLPIRTHLSICFCLIWLKTPKFELESRVLITKLTPMHEAEIAYPNYEK